MLKDFFDSIKLDVTSKSNIFGNNIYTILGLENSEIRHSNFLAYLFDSKKNLNIGNTLLQNFLQSANINKHLYPFNLENIFKDGAEIEVSRENNNIDIAINIMGYAVILVENKIWSDEHDNQLFRYKNLVCQRLVNPVDKLFQNKIKIPICIYLTPNGRDAKSDNDWVAVGYDKIFAILRSFAKSKKFGQLTARQKLMILDYIEILEMYIVKKNKEEIKLILDTFFSNIEKKKIIEEIIEYAPDYKQRANLIKDVMRKNNINVLSSSLSANAYINFIPQSFETIFQRIGVKDNLFYFQLSNNSSFKNSTISTYFNFQSSQSKDTFVAEKFFELINKKKLTKDFSKDRSLGLSVIFLSEHQEYSLDEKTKQSKIVEFFELFESNPKIKYIYDSLLKLEEFLKTDEGV